VLQDYSVFQRIVACCSVLQCRGLEKVRDRMLFHKSVLQCVAACCSVLLCIAVCCCMLLGVRVILQHIATHCSSLQHTATQCNTLQYTAIHCNTLQVSRFHDFLALQSWFRNAKNQLTPFFLMNKFCQTHAHVST